MTVSHQPEKPLPDWRFAEKQSSVLNRDPFEAEFFTPDGQADALVREVIQNSMDARQSPTTPVRVRFAFSGPEKAVEAASYTEGLREHLLAAGNKVFTAIGSEDMLMRFVTIEDFGTRGLIGDPLQSKDNPPGTTAPDNFYRFWRNVGRSSKGGNDRGRWGLGKTVFPSSSLINTLWGYTIRADDDRRLLMGQSVARIHELGGKTYFPEGFYARFDKTGFQLPFETHKKTSADADPLAKQEAKKIAQFLKDFSLTRIDEPGLSVVIPFPSEKLSPEGLIQSAIVHFFFTILKGELVVEVHSKSASVIIREDTIEAVAKTVKWESDQRKEKKHAPPPFGLARRAIVAQKSGALPVLNASGVKKAPAWVDGEALFPGKMLAQQRKILEVDGWLGLRVPVHIETKTTAGGKNHFVPTFFDVFIEVDKELPKAEDHFIREGMTIPRVTSMQGQKQVRALVIVDAGPLSALLGDSEGPAHTDWSHQERRPEEKYEKWASRLTFVKNSPSRLFQLLQPPPTGLDKDLLKSIFSIQAVTQKKPAKGKTLAENQESGPTSPPPPPDPKPFRLEPIKGGFKVVGEKTTPEMQLEVRAAYDVESGDPFRLYEAADFKFEDPALNISAIGAKISERANNRLEVDVEGAKFQIEVQGFDELRDLVVKVREI